MAQINGEVIKGNLALGMVLDSLLTDITNLHTELNVAISDMGVMRTATNLAISKLNADGGVSDADYAAITALTTAAVTALTTTS